VRLYHATDDKGVAGIRAQGFALSYVRDSGGAAWFAGTREGADTGSANRTWLVVVEVPDEVADAHRYRFEDGSPYLDNFRIPFEIVNIYKPFKFERLG
jgi:hypothetical protein